MPNPVEGISFLVFVYFAGIVVHSQVVSEKNHIIVTKIERKKMKANVESIDRHEARPWIHGLCWFGYTYPCDYHLRRMCRIERKGW